MKWTDHFVGFLDDVERAALSLVARVGPWAAPIAPAYFIARAAARHLSAPVAVAWAMGVAVEAVGIAAFIATLRAFTWNQERRTHDAPAPVLLGLLLIIVYLGVGIGLAVIVEVFPPIIPWAPAAFFVLAGVAYLVLGMMSDQARRERQADERSQHDQAMRAFRAAVRERGLSKAEGEAMLAQAGDPWTALDRLADIDRTPVTVSQSVHAVTRRWQDKWAFVADADRPDDLTPRQVAELAGVSERTARRWLKAVRNGKDG